MPRKMDNKQKSYCGIEIKPLFTPTVVRSRYTCELLESLYF